ncbi:hypothetical protein LMG26411_01558 [Cupriavidus numazuensis]|uniref:Uncharacterized protein n=1 Tax=Cupriavidus numazuensis TaxID=221992 RepID=A0ABN7PZF3_9BURK|nr:hypothetical protein LMG26411_01558 [Cupriavidus numazuensis]
MDEIDHEIIVNPAIIISEINDNKDRSTFIINIIDELTSLDP